MIKPHLSLVKSSNSKDYFTLSTVRQFTVVSDEPIGIEGTDLGPSPFDLLNISLASCTAMYIRKQAKKRQIDIGEINVKIKISKGEEEAFLFERIISFENKLSQGEKLFLEEESKNTPVTKIITNSQQIKTIIR
jgi:putative redox protein